MGDDLIAKAVKNNTADNGGNLYIIRVCLIPEVVNHSYYSFVRTM